MDDGFHELVDAVIEIDSQDGYLLAGIQRMKGPETMGPKNVTTSRESLLRARL